MTGRLFLQWIRDRPRDKLTTPEAAEMVIWTWIHLQEESREGAWECDTDPAV
jgi:hypothetical protein